MSPYLPEEQARSLEQFAVGIAIEAGRTTLQYFRGNFHTEYKADNSPVTEADREAERLLRREIASHFPEHAIIGEEFGESPGASEPAGDWVDSPDSVRWTWILDPIDGTKSFIHGIPLYTVLVALLRNNEPVLGVIHNPALEETVSAVRGFGCFLNGEQCSVRSCEHLSEAGMIVTDPADFYRREPLLAHDLYGRVSFVRTWADAYGYLMVATGRADLMIDPILSVWDVAALAPVIEEAGGVFSDISGRRTGLGSSAIAAGPEIHRQVVAIPRS